MWTDVVVESSRRRLTFASDRRPALAGITNEFADRLDDKAFHGLWLNDIHRGLTFMEDGGRPGPVSASTPDWNDSPSWSWFSSQKALFWDDRLYELPIHRISTICAVNPCSSPQNMQLQLCGKLMKCPRKFASIFIAAGPDYGVNIGETSEHDGLRISVGPDQWFVLHVKDYFQWDAVKNPDERDHTFIDQWLGTLVFMPILCYNVTSYIDQHIDEVKCLLLQLQPTLECGVYRRAGDVSMALNGIAQETVTPETINDQLKGVQGPLEDHMYQEVDSDGNYTIILI